MFQHAGAAPLTWCSLFRSGSHRPSGHRGPRLGHGLSSLGPPAAPSIRSSRYRRGHRPDLSPAGRIVRRPPSSFPSWDRLSRSVSAGCRIFARLPQSTPYGTPGPQGSLNRRLSAPSDRVNYGRMTEGSRALSIQPFFCGFSVCTSH
ncbi:hypothetical protein NDU88_006602 [Pleurodeles waltl]|uniref:Uncharacterized protein n=1 Tax=Pleurodeles waltl TaxID=8319 RepID=A0AAV7VN60_PLEWA|nr:hypothetical protein NDU88_006602 [Pleurodeles waltl]